MILGTSVSYNLIII